MFGHLVSSSWLAPEPPEWIDIGNYIDHMEKIILHLRKMCVVLICNAATNSLWMYRINMLFSIFSNDMLCLSNNVHSSYIWKHLRWAVKDI